MTFHSWSPSKFPNSDLPFLIILIISYKHSLCPQLLSLKTNLFRKRNCCDFSFPMYLISCFGRGDSVGDFHISVYNKKTGKRWFSTLSGYFQDRGWENRTPAKGFGDPYHTTWPIPYLSKLCVCLRDTRYLYHIYWWVVNRWF